MKWRVAFPSLAHVALVVIELLLLWHIAFFSWFAAAVPERAEEASAAALLRIGLLVLSLLIHAFVCFVTFRCFAGHGEKH